MKKYRLAMLCLGALALSACSSFSDSNNEKLTGYTGEVVLSSMQGNDLKLTIAKKDCGKFQCEEQAETVVYPYDSNIVVGACVQVDLDENGKITKITNVSRSKSNSVLSRTGKY